MASPRSVGVIVHTPTSRDLSTILRGIRDQTHPPETVILVGRHSPCLVDEWSDDLPLHSLRQPGANPSRQFNQALSALNTNFVVRVADTDYWHPRYLEILVDTLRDHPNAGAAAGELVSGSSLTSFKRDAWFILQHPLGTGAPRLAGPDDSDPEGPLRSPVYRREALESIGGIPEELPWAGGEELHRRLRAKNWPLLYQPEVKLYHDPPGTCLGLARNYFRHGKGRGRLGRRGLFPSDRHQKLDRALMLWTLGLSWNPVGWGLFLFYMMVVGMLTLDQRTRGDAGLRLFYLFPLAHVSYWIGWIATRFRG